MASRFVRSMVLTALREAWLLSHVSTEQGTVLWLDGERGVEFREWCWLSTHFSYPDIDAWIAEQRAVTSV